ncbi:MAG: SDR family NAD(P)-dependent oxidoreductase [Bacteroidales bacterium]|nr:SDR family NAD(P)-dependent oxidoreductase [Bacteroidales bacterium]
MNKIALISGASAGIGYAIAEILANNNFDLIITGRRKERLDTLKAQIEKRTKSKVICLCFDIRNKEEVFNSIECLPQEFKKIDVLVNNAGLASGLGVIQDGDLEDWEKMIDTNVKGLLYLSRAVSPLMIENKKGHIVNIGSLAGREVYPNGNVYCATKHAVDALSKAMRIDLLPHGIKVTQIAPGLVETEFSIVRFHGNKERADNVYKDMTPLCPDDIADAVLYVITRPKHVCINDMLITPTAQASSTNVIRTK